MNRKIIQNKKQYRIPDGEITYSDLNISAKVLFSKGYRIAGKPDYIIKKHNYYIPVEIKSGIYSNPHKNHILQLAAYCQLLEDNYKSLVPYGIIIYKNSDFKIPFDPKLRFELESVIKMMRNSLHGKVVLNHNDPNKCRICSMRMYCKEKLS